MLRIEEIVGAMDDEFRYALDSLSDQRLAELAADKSALRRLRPVGVSTAEALAMITAIQERRAQPQPVKPPRKPRLRKPKAKVVAAVVEPEVPPPPAAIPTEHSDEGSCQTRESGHRDEQAFSQTFEMTGNGAGQCAPPPPPAVIPTERNAEPSEMTRKGARTPPTAPLFVLLVLLITLALLATL